MAVCAQRLAARPWPELGWACPAPSGSPEQLGSWSLTLGLAGHLLWGFGIL